jgi:uncharacterized protein (DUF2062 family)
MRLKLLQALRSGDRAHHLAVGLAVGVFWACFPLFILHIPLAVATAWILRASRLGAAVGVLVANPVTMGPLYAAAFAVGAVVTPADPDSPLRNPEMLSAGWEVVRTIDGMDFLTLFVGSALISVPASVATYGASKAWAHRYLERREARRAAGAARKAVRAAALAQAAQAERTAGQSDA